MCVSESRNNVSTQDVPIWQTKDWYGHRIGYWHNKVSYVQNVYIMTNIEISDTKTKVYFKVLYGPSFDFLLSTRCMNQPLQTMFTTQEVNIWQNKALYVPRRDYQALEI